MIPNARSRRTGVKLVIVYKWARNQADVMVRADGSIDWRNAQMAAGEDDPAALAAARQLAQDAGGELVGLTIGDGDASWALARGVEQAYSVPDAPKLADNAATAALLAAALRRIGNVDLVVIGDARSEPGVAVSLAGILGWPALVGLQSASIVDGQLHAVRRTGTALQTLALPTPAVLGMAAEADLDRPPGMKELLAARRRPVTTLTMADLGINCGDVASISFQRPETTPTRIFTGEPADTAAQLIAALHAEDVL